MKMTPLIRPLSILSDQFSVASSRAIRVLCSDLKSDWQLASKSLSLTDNYITVHGLVWGGSRQATITSDLVGGKLNMFDFQTS